jgi:GDPmannose 4,6-dehydratase
MKKAFITGVLGQDGTYLKNILLSNNYKVIGFDKFVYLNNDIEYYSDDITDYDVVFKFVKTHQPDIIFNLAGISDIFDPWNNLSEVIKNNITIPENFIKSIINLNSNIIFCQASSCLVFGNSESCIQNETTPRAPLYPYGLSKNFIDGLIKGYRQEKGMNFCSAIFYNHDSPYRGDKFFIKKLINFAKLLKTNKLEKMNFLDLNLKKDLGYAEDYMNAFYLMSQAEKKDDYIISSGRLTNLLSVVEQVSNLAGINLLDYMIINNNVKQSKTVLFGDNSKIKTDLNWHPSKSYEEVVDLIWKNNI